MSAIADALVSFDTLGNHADFRGDAFGTEREFDRKHGISNEDLISSALSLEGIHLSFGGVTALSDVTIHVKKGEIRSIIGPNGAGKSSLINVICGVYKPDSGRVVLDGRSFDQVPTQKLASLGVARTFQNLALFKGLTVRDNIATGLSWNRRSTFLGDIFGLPLSRSEEKAAREKADAIIGFLHLEGIADRLSGTLPYGLQKRVELARALIGQPDLLLLDEPMAGTTVTEKQEMADFIRLSRSNFGTTIILIEHDIGVVMELSDHVAVLDYGRKIADGIPEDVCNDQAVIDAYLGVPHDIEQGGGI